MNENRVEGTVGDTARKLKEVSGDKISHIESQAGAIAAKAADVGTQTFDQIKDFMSRRPMTSLVTAVGIGVALSFLLRRR